MLGRNEEAENEPEGLEAVGNPAAFSANADSKTYSLLPNPFTVSVFRSCSLGLIICG